MKIVERNDGRKIAYNLDGTKLDFADGALSIDLDRYQKDDPVTRDIMVDSEGFLVMGHGLYYVAQVEIPAREYAEIPRTDEGENSDDMSNINSVEKKPLPVNTDNVKLYLFVVDGIHIC